MEETVSMVSLSLSLPLSLGFSELVSNFFIHCVFSFYIYRRFSSRFWILRVMPFSLGVIFLMFLWWNLRSEMHEDLEYTLFATWEPKGLAMEGFMVIKKNVYNI